MPRFSPVWWRAAAKEELFHFPLYRWIIRSIGAFPVRRGQRDFASMSRMVEVVRTDVLVVFPEGTWSTTGKLLPGRLGMGKVIYDAKPAKVIPAAIKGTDEILPRTSWIPRINRSVKIVYGPPMDLGSFYQLPHGEETSRKVVDAVMAEISRLHTSL